MVARTAAASSPLTVSRFNASVLSMARPREARSAAGNSQPQPKVFPDAQARITRGWQRKERWLGVWVGTLGLEPITRGDLVGAEERQRSRFDAAVADVGSL